MKSLRAAALTLAVAASAALAASFGAAPAAGAKPPPAKPARLASFTADQAYEGRFQYINQCAECHAGYLQGHFGPALQGPDSNVPWQTPETVWKYMTVHMPVGNAGGLAQKDYLAIMAFIMQSNGRHAGRSELTPAAIAADPAALDGTR